MKSVAIIVLNYNTASVTDALATCLRTLTYPDKDVYVIDNGSTEPLLSSTHRLPENVGFTNGMHQGYKIASAAKKYDAYWFVNSDIEIHDPAILTALMEVLFSNESFAQVSPQHNSPHAHMRSANSASQTVPWLEPTATLIRASTIDKVGFWDLDCTLGWGVDYDYGYRIRQVGLQSVITNRARVLHKEHGSQSSPSDYGFRAQAEMTAVLSKKYGINWYNRINSGRVEPTPVSTKSVGDLPLVVCAIFRNEAPYLREWLEFHLLMGVSHFTLYQNRSDDDWRSVLEPYIQTGVVTLIEWPMPGNTQIPAYNHFLTNNRGKQQWAAIIDIDEFLFPLKHDTVPQALATLPESWGAIGVNWIIFGASDHEEYSPELVTERFTWRPCDSFHVNTHIKSILRTDRNPVTRGDAHHFEVQGFTYNEKGVRLNGAHSPGHTSTLLRINHYSTKSRQEYYRRISLGRVDGVGYVPPKVFDERQDHDIDDRTIQRFLPALKARMTMQVLEAVAQ